MKAWIVLLLILPAVAALEGEKDFVSVDVNKQRNYPSDAPVTVDVIASLWKDARLTDTPVRIEVWDAAHRQRVPVVDQDIFNAGIAPEQWRQIRFGELEPGQYQVLVIAKASGFTQEYPLVLHVLHPVIEYTMDVQEKEDKTGVLSFKPDKPDPAQNFTITLTRGNGQLVHTYREWNQTRIEIPYLPREVISIHVQDPNGWSNTAELPAGVPYGHGPDVLFFPDADLTVQGEKLGFWRNIAWGIVAVIGVVGVTAVGLYDRRIRARQEE